MRLYYHPEQEKVLVLSAEESAHLVKVLRKKSGDYFSFTDGCGHCYEAQIVEAHPKKCVFRVLSKTASARKLFHIHVAIAPTKSAARLEWFVEKACELGVDEITIIRTQRTERAPYHVKRLEKKAISAMKQSGSCWKCEIQAVTPLTDFLLSQASKRHKFMATARPESTDKSFQQKLLPHTDVVVLIGPEGDFTTPELQSAQELGFVPVSLGDRVLRTETAGVVAAHTVCLMNQVAGPPDDVLAL